MAHRGQNHRHFFLKLSSIIDVWVINKIMHVPGKPTPTLTGRRHKAFTVHVLVGEGGVGVWGVIFH